MENYISVNMFRRKLTVNTCREGESYTGIVDQVLDGVVMLVDNSKKYYIAADKIVSFFEVE